MAQLIKYTNRGHLREHPYLSPALQASPLQNTAYIFPGDELVFYHDIDLPGDGNVASINSIVLKDAKVSVIAQRPQVYSEQYTFQYKSTRNFDLDSFQTSFNNVNAPVIPWGVLGADGYAPYVNVATDRNWKLPSGDFRRQVKFFTTHVNGTAAWRYTFYFPVIFRWEEWISKLIPAQSGGNYFYNPTQPQNGLNEFWYHYFVLGTWIFKSRLELNVLINGVPTTIRNDHNFTPGNIDRIRTYDSNPDWINKSIKTNDPGTAPSNTPCLIYGNAMTEVTAEMNKVAAWALPNEQAQLSAVMWIEPYQDAGLPVRTRASSLYPITPESVFLGLNTSITDDSGTQLQTSSGDYIVTDNSSNGVMILFGTGATLQKIKIIGIIDYNKLAIVYPGVTKFTLYCRLYNGRSTTANVFGEEIRQDVTLVNPAQNGTTCSFNQPPCPFNMTVFADKTNPDDLINDKSDFYEYGDAYISSVSFTLQKNASSCGTGAWTDVVILANNALGNFFAFGKNPDFSGINFIDDYGKKYTGLLMEWRKVLQAYDSGLYRMKIVKTDVFGGVVTYYDQRLFCLKNYNCNLINRTVRIEVVNEGLRGTLADHSVKIDYAGGWKSQWRLRGVFKYKTSTYVKEFNQYGESDFNAFKPTINEQSPKYILSIRPVPGWMDFILSTNVLQADKIEITDYNNSNRHENFQKIPVMNDGEFTPRDNNLRNPLSDVEITLAYGQNSLRKTNSQ